METYITITLVALAIISVIAAPSFKCKVIYEGEAHAMPNEMPHYSKTTRTVFIVFGDQLPEHPILVADVSLEKAAAIAKASPVAPVHVVVKQRGRRQPYVASVA